MLPRRIILALTLALAWCWGAWHEDLEAAGWMFEHDHHHAAHHDHHHESNHSGSHEHSPLTGDDHEPVWARGLTPGALAISFVEFVFATIAVMGLWAFVFNLRLANAKGPCRRTRRARSFDPVWHFVRRCAPDVAAPPALS